MKMKKVISGVLATVAALGCAATMTACETSRPEVEIVLTFQGEEYELNYTLYRKVAPATVEHFLTLAEEGYYTNQNICVHDFADSRMYMGAYKYENETLVYQNYYDIVKGYENFSATVFTDKESKTPTYTLYGEFASNKFSVENGKKSETYGSLTMYYTNKSSEDRVFVDHPEAGEATRDYKYNSATSQFFISLTEADKSNSSYCTFATLDESDVDTLKALQAAVEEYAADEDGVNQITVDVDEDDRYVGQQGNTQTYDVLTSPVVIKSVTVKKF